MIWSVTTWKNLSMSIVLFENFYSLYLYFWRTQKSRPKAFVSVSIWKHYFPNVITKFGSCRCRPTRLTTWYKIIPRLVDLNKPSLARGLQGQEGELTQSKMTPSQSVPVVPTQQLRRASVVLHVTTQSRLKLEVNQWVEWINVWLVEARGRDLPPRGFSANGYLLKASVHTRMGWTAMRITEQFTEKMVVEVWNSRPFHFFSLFCSFLDCKTL